VTSIRTEPATADRWDDVVTAFGHRGDDPGWCWCRRFLDAPTDVDHAADNRAALRAEIATAEVAPGIVAYVDGSPAGWTRVMPRRDVPAIARNRALRRVLDDDPDAWWVTCFAVSGKHRSMGVARALLEAAVAHAERHGASVVDGHPVDVDALGADRVGASALFTARSGPSLPPASRRSAARTRAGP
jgi:GNAT superfamily N-acetyltransferase